MGIRFALALLLSCFALPAFASSPLLQGHGVPPAPADIQITPVIQPQQMPVDTHNITPMPSSLADQVISNTMQGTITWQSFCQTLVQHQPTVDANYRSGTDVRGQPVTPADLQNQQALNLPQNYRVFITTDQISKLGISIPGVPLKADTFVGQAVVSADGSMTFNGQPVSTQQVYAVCGQVGR